MLLTGNTSEKSAVSGGILREVGNYRDRLFERPRKVTPWTLNLQVEGVVLPATAALTYLVLWFLLHSIAPDFHLLSEQWSWNLSAGLSFGFLIGFGLAYLPIVFLAHLLPLVGQASTSTDVLQLFVFAAGNTAAYGLACFAVGRALSSRNIDLEDRSMLGIVLALIPLTALAGALVSALNWRLSGVLSTDGLVQAVLIKTFGNGMGLLMVGLFVALNGIPLLNRLVERTTFSELTRPIKPRVSHLVQGSALFAVSMTASIVALGSENGDRFDIYLLVFVPLIAMGLRFGIRGLATSFLAVGCGGSAVGIVGYTTQAGIGSDATVFFALLSSLIVASLATETTRRESTMRTQAVLMDAVARTTDQMLRTSDQDKDVNRVLQHLLRDIDATRLYVLENQQDKNLSGHHPMYYENWKPGTRRDAHLEEMLAVVRNSLITENKELLAGGGVLECSAMELSRQDRSVLHAVDIGGSIIIPIFADDRWWGCLGVDRSTSSRWSNHEISALRATGGVLGSLLAHANVEQQFRQITGNIPAVFWIGQPSGLKKTYVSPAFEQIWGLSPEVVANNPQAWIGAIHLEDYNRIHDELPKQRTGEFDVEYRIVPPAGPVRWVRDTAFPVQNVAGEVNRIVGIAQDITPQKKAEEHVRATTLLLRSLIDNLRPGIVVEDGERHVRHANRAFCEMFGVQDPGDSLPQVDAFLSLSPARLRSEELGELIQAGEARQGQEIESGDGRIFSRDYMPLSFDNGDVYHLWSYEDITDRKRTEQQIRASLDEKEILLKEIHHRVKNNLQVISSLLHLQATNIGDEDIAEAFRDSQSRVKAMALVHERLYQSSDLARIDFGGYVKEITRHLSRSYHAHANGAEMELDIQPVAVNIDTAIPCGLIINELVSNSLKYAFPGDRTGHVRVRLSQDNAGTCQLSISDDGVGFPIDRFEKKGDSLGLQLVRSLVSQLNGSVQYLNEEGAEFLIEFQPNVQESQGESKNPVG